MSRTRWANATLMTVKFIGRANVNGTILGVDSK